MLEMERSNLAFIQAGRNSVQSIAPSVMRSLDQGAQDIARGPHQPGNRLVELMRAPELTPSQEQAVKELLESTDRVIGFVCVAGSGKSNTLNAVRRSAELKGFAVLGMSPTSRAAARLAETAGIRNPITVHHFLLQLTVPGQDKRLLMVDEASLASTRMVSELWKRLGPEDRVILVGDPRQHQSVEAGRFFEAALEQGMKSVRLDTILRQQDEKLRRAVELLAQGRFYEGVKSLREQGRVHEIAKEAERIQAISSDYARSPAGTLVISPDNETRRELNKAMRDELQKTGGVAKEEHQLKILVQRSELTGADRSFAAKYEPGNVIRYGTGSKAMGLRGGEYAQVVAIEQKANLLTVRKGDGSTLTYNPLRLRGVNVFRQQNLNLAAGDRIQMTAPFKAKRVANRELGTVEAVDAAGNLRVKLDSGREIELNIAEHRSV